MKRAVKTESPAATANQDAGIIDSDSDDSDKVMSSVIAAAAGGGSGSNAKEGRKGGVGVEGTGGLGVFTSVFESIPPPDESESDMEDVQVFVPNGMGSAGKVKTLQIEPARP
jgi:hypothetical protein